MCENYYHVRLVRERVAKARSAPLPSDSAAKRFARLRTGGVPGRPARADCEDEVGQYSRRRKRRCRIVRHVARYSHPTDDANPWGNPSVISEEIMCTRGDTPARNVRVVLRSVIFENNEPRIRVNINANPPYFAHDTHVSKLSNVALSSSSATQQAPFPLPAPPVKSPQTNDAPSSPLSQPSPSSTTPNTSVSSVLECPADLRHDLNERLRCVAELIERTHARARGRLAQLAQAES